jgi:hypothetical protein
LISPSDNAYARWRARVCARYFLHDEQFPAERLVQAIWQHQRLRRGELKTADGKSVRVFHPGFANLEGGPDFRGAVLQIGADPPCSGDVEVDLRPAGWRAHGHDRNPNFHNVRLHVVWEQARPASGQSRLAPDNVKTTRQPEVLPLKGVLDAPLTELSLSLENESLRLLPENMRGKCHIPLRELDEPELLRLLDQAARVRLENKAAHFRARAKDVGWEQTLWEHLFRALGYKHNVWPMQYLAEQRPRILAPPEGDGARAADPLLALQARLLGIGGLLPEELARAARKSSNGYWRRLWDVWWRERDGFSDAILPRASWKFHGVRPANHPSRRLALACHWLADSRFIPKIENWIGVENDAVALAEILQGRPDDFWSWHWTFTSAPLKKPQPLLGEGRVTDLAVNVILPWLWVRAAEGGNESIRNEVERRFFAWPASEDNAVLKLARQRLLGTSTAGILKTASAQQGLIQIVRDFCERSNAACDNCEFPGLARGFGSC